MSPKPPAAGKKAAAPRRKAPRAGKRETPKSEKRVYDGPLRVNPPPRRPDRILFGTGGVPHSARPQDHLGAVRRLKELGLGGYEMEFVYGVRIRPETREGVRALVAETGLRLTAHGPYYVNLFSLEAEKLEASRVRVLDTARALADCGGNGACFHAGFYQKRDPAQVYAHMRGQIAELADILAAEGCPVRLDPETTGKATQFGSLEELTDLARELKGKRVGITVDFSHLHARTGGANNTYEEFGAQLQRIRDRLGAEGLSAMHIHLSGIEYGEKGERNHLDIDESDMNYRDQFRALIDFGAEGLVICESPGLEYDALIMQKAYRELHGS